MKKEKNLLAAAQQKSTLKNRISKLESETELNNVHYDDLFNKNQTLKDAKDDLKRTLRARLQISRKRKRSSRRT